MPAGSEVRLLEELKQPGAPPASCGTLLPHRAQAEGSMCWSRQPGGCTFCTTLIHEAPVVPGKCLAQGHSITVASSGFKPRLSQLKLLFSSHTLHQNYPGERKVTKRCCLKMQNPEPHSSPQIMIQELWAREEILL